jgi:hypothetical protein
VSSTQNRSFRRKLKPLHDRYFSLSIFVAKGRTKHSFKAVEKPNFVWIHDYKISKIDRMSIRYLDGAIVSAEYYQTMSSSSLTQRWYARVSWGVG